MGHSKISVTIPDKTYQDIKLVSSKMNIKVSHFVSAALAEKLKKIVDKSRLLEKIGSLSDAMKEAVVDGCQMSISLKIF
jgi:hypothetical protein